MREYVEPTSEERERVAMGYLLWPVAALDLLQTRDASRWFEMHMRQAVLLGVFLGLAVTLIMSLPLVAVVIFNGPDPVAVIRLYTISFFVDVVTFAAAVAYVVRLSIKASRGEHFAVPVIGRIVARGFYLGG